MLNNEEVGFIRYGFYALCRKGTRLDGLKFLLSGMIYNMFGIIFVFSFIAWFCGIVCCIIVPFGILMSIIDPSFSETELTIGLVFNCLIFCIFLIVQNHAIGWAVDKAERFVHKYEKKIRRMAAKRGDRIYLMANL